MKDLLPADEAGMCLPLGRIITREFPQIKKAAETRGLFCLDPAGV